MAGGMGWCNGLEDLYNAGAPMDDSTLQTLKVIHRRLTDVIAGVEARSQSGEGGPTAEAPATLPLRPPSILSKRR